MPHQGEILQEAIKNSGISITRIVEELGITRPTIYRKFRDETLDVNFVTNVGRIIGYDFSHDFALQPQAAIPFVTPISRQSVAPAVSSRASSPAIVDNDLSKQLLALQAKYIALLEAYNELLLRVYGPR